MRGPVHLCVLQRCRQFIDIVRRQTPGQEIRKEFRLVFRNGGHPELLIRFYNGQIYNFSSIIQYYLCQNLHFSPIPPNSFQRNNKERPGKVPGARLCISNCLSGFYWVFIFLLAGCIFCTFCILGVMAKNGKVRKVQKVQAGIRGLFIALLILAVRDVAEEIAL